MIIADLKKLFQRDLTKLKDEIALYPNEQSVWATHESTTNSGGNVCLHLIGNLKSYIGDGLGQTGFIRNRELEFSQKFMPQNELLKEIDETIEVVEMALGKLNEEQLKDDFPIVIWKDKTKMGFTLFHLHGHLTYHLGQINYHRRIVGTQKTTA